MNPKKRKDTNKKKIPFMIKETNKFNQVSIKALLKSETNSNPLLLRQLYLLLYTSALINKIQ